MTIPVTPAANTPISAASRIRPSAAEQSSGNNAVSAVAKVGETVELSQQAQQLQQVSARLSAQPAVDQSRIERLREAIESGSYQIDSKLTASNLLAFERGL